MINEDYERNCIKLIRENSIPLPCFQCQKTNNDQKESIKNAINISVTINEKIEIAIEDYIGKNTNNIKVEKETILPELPLKKAWSVGDEPKFCSNCGKKIPYQHVSGNDSFESKKWDKVLNNPPNKQISHGVKKWVISSTEDFSLSQSIPTINSKASNKIIDVIKKICRWRQLCYNEVNISNEYITSKFNAASNVGIKKKTLDDFLMYLRLGIALNFDFQENLFKKFGVLRKFIKINRKGLRWNKNQHEDVECLLAHINNIP